MKQRPHLNCYWVEPGRLMAGEYPIHWHSEEPSQKLQNILDSGVDDFLDLTDPADRLADYRQMVGSKKFFHRRMTIRDMDVPSPESMGLILDHLHERLQQGRCVYVHCWGGIGRTGTVVGCHLVEQGMSPTQALETIAQHWQTVEKFNRFPRSPQTDAQVEFVLNWRKGRGR